METGKRKAPEAARKPETCEEVREWLSRVIEDGGCGKVKDEDKEAILGRVVSEEVDVEVLGQLTEADLTEVLGVKVLGQRKKMMSRIRELISGEVGGAGTASAPASGAGIHNGGGTHNVEVVVIDPGPHRRAEVQPQHSHQQPPEQLLQQPPQQQQQHEQQNGKERAVPEPPAPRRSSGGGSSGGGNSAGIAGRGGDDDDIMVVDPGSGGGGGGRGGADFNSVDGRESPQTVVKKKRQATLELGRDVLNKMQAEQNCVVEGQFAADKMLKALRESDKWAIPSVKASMLEELEEAKKRVVMPGCSVVTVGDTGAGKSTLLNALLGETNVLPTNGMRACTASIIELSYNDSPDGEPYVGEVEFVSSEEWEAELSIILDDLTQQDGRAILREPAPNAPNYPSWCKLFAVFGREYTQSAYDGFDEKGQRRKLNPTIPELKRRLKFATRVTRNCGKKVEVTASTPKEFKKKLEKYMDSTNEVEEGQFWPLVKMVRMKGRNWTLLKTGCTLVDAPGVNDENNARDKVVKNYLKHADSVWIVANIKRAVNDKTAKNMLGENFRRQLLMDGQYGQVVFVATQSDVVLPSEIKRNLQLPADTTISECGIKRNDFTRKRLKLDYRGGIEEMAKHAGGVVDSEELLQRYGDLPVFCVSSVEYQILSGVREEDGRSRVYEDIEDTEIPALQLFLHNNVLEKRLHNTKRCMTDLVNFCDSLRAFLEDADEKKNATLAAKRKQMEDCKRAFEDGVRGIDALLRGHVGDLSKQIDTQFSTVIGPQLQSGSREASESCVSRARIWHEGGGGAPKMHHSTYRATVRRHGVFRMNFNEDLAQDIFRTVSTVWERTFVSVLQKDVQATTSKMCTEFKKAHEEIARKLADSTGVSAQRLQSIQAPQMRSIEGKMASAMDTAKAHATERQKELTRSITPKVQEAMTPGYDSGMMEAGIGSHLRRAEKVVSHVSSRKEAMFQDAVKPVQDALPMLRADLTKLLTEAAVNGQKSMRVAYSSLWEEQASDAAATAAKKKVLSYLDGKGFLNMAQVAMRKLLVAHGLEKEEVEGDDELEDTTNAHKAPQVFVSLLSDDEDAHDPSAWPPLDPTRVKKEQP